MGQDWLGGSGGLGTRGSLDTLLFHGSSKFFISKKILVSYSSQIILIMVTVVAKSVGKDDRLSG